MAMMSKFLYVLLFICTKSFATEPKLEMLMEGFSNQVNATDGESFIALIKKGSHFSSRYVKSKILEDTQCGEKASRIDVDLDYA